MNRFQLYTDGACQPNPGTGGWAFILEGIKNGKSIKIERSGGQKETTNNRMELQAAIEGFKHFAENFWVGDDEIVLVSDSKYLIQGIDNWCEGWSRRGWKKSNNKSVLNSDLWQDILALKKMIRPTCKHVRGHVGHEMNERADQLAVKAAQRTK